MLDLHLTTKPIGADAVTAGYSCPCGCSPATTYRRGDQVATEGCCCGNEFAVGPEAASRVHAPSGYEVRTDSLVAPWGERVPVVWAIGPSTHDEAGHDAVGHEEGHGVDGHHDHDRNAGSAIDPVCGMAVDPEASRAMGLHSTYEGTDYFFCGKGCKLEFDDDPEHYLNPSHVPSM
jgi:YHS domain-containing protein